jgi:hypothetical protein
MIQWATWESSWPTTFGVDIRISLRDSLRENKLSNIRDFVAGTVIEIMRSPTDTSVTQHGSKSTLQDSARGPFAFEGET